MLRRLMPRLGTANIWEADRALLVVLGALADAISPGEAHDLGSQLPDAYHELMMERAGRGGPHQAMDRAGFLDRVQRELRLEGSEQAERVAGSVLAVLKEAVTPGEIEDVVRELMPELRATVERA